jgi:hypothetical protein
VTWRVAQVQAEATSMAVSCQTAPWSAEAADAKAVQLDQLAGVVDVQGCSGAGAGCCGSGGAA